MNKIPTNEPVRYGQYLEWKEKRKMKKILVWSIIAVTIFVSAYAVSGWDIVETLKAIAAVVGIFGTAAIFSILLVWAYRPPE